MDKSAFENAKRWARGSGTQDLKDFEDLLNIIKPVAVEAHAIEGGTQLDVGAFGSIETAYFHGSKVAVKYVKPGTGRTLSQQFRLVKLELQVVTQIRHPMIVNFMGVAVKFPTANENPNCWTLGMIFELCEGGQLNKLLHTPNNMPLNNFSSAEKLRMSKDIAIGLTYLHSLRYYHRDLSTRNLLLTAQGKVKICDFGCARKILGESYQSTTISGSPPWMAPEQIKGESLTLAADLFSFGTILWEIATEKIPHFEVRDDMKSIEKAVAETGLRPRLPGPEHMGDLPANTKSHFNRLLVLLHKQKPHLRPTADQTQKILLGMETESASNLSPSRPQGKSTDALLLELEDHVRMAESLELFYQRYNPDQIKHLPKMLNTFFGRQEELCAELREKYKADLYGECAPPAAYNNHITGPQRTRTQSQQRSSSSKPPAAHQAAAIDDPLLDLPILDELGYLVLLIKNFLSLHNPQAISRAEDMASTYFGREDELNEMLRERHNGCDLNEPYRKRVNVDLGNVVLEHSKVGNLVLEHSKRNGRQVDVGVFVENGLQEHPGVPRARRRTEANDRVLYVDDDFPAIPEIQSSPSIRIGAGNISISSPFLNGQDAIAFPNRFFPVQSSPSNGKGTGKISSSASTIREALQSNRNHDFHDIPGLLPGSNIVRTTTRLTPESVVTREEIIFRQSKSSGPPPPVMGERDYALPLLGELDGRPPRFGGQPQHQSLSPPSQMQAPSNVSFPFGPPPARMGGGPPPRMGPNIGQSMIGRMGASPSLSPMGLPSPPGIGPMGGGTFSGVGLMGGSSMGPPLPVMGVGMLGLGPKRMF